ncbi:MAG: hypothetical protein CFE21_07190 [Bacteroidetes bacterium B1(2017)]|nr:MAG: hypothetical protein CFE21_07190 [Bacteroidetes bacterium B1(2017)]
MNYAKFNRQIKLPGFGLLQQKKLFEAKVLLIGAGGLGCPALLYLAAAGVGQIGVVDFDTVEESNLARQILFDANDIGQLKAQIACTKIQQAFPDSTLTPFTFKLDESTIEITNDFDLVIDGSDNFETRYLLNDYCAAQNTPLIYGSVSRYEGQVGVFNVETESGQKFNLRDIFPIEPKSGMVENCAEAGVLGVVAGLIGILQATEAIKLITGLGSNLNQEMLTYNALSNQFYSVQITPKSKSIIHSEPKTIEDFRSELEEIDYKLIALLEERNELIKKIAKVKKESNMEIVQAQQWEKTMAKKLIELEKLSLNKEFVLDIFNRIHQESIAEQKKYYGNN